MVVVVGLKAAGRDLTREMFVTGIESLHSGNMELGQNLRLGYSPKDHQEFNSVYATIIHQGHALDLEDWDTLETE